MANDKTLSKILSPQRIVTEKYYSAKKVSRALVFKHTTVIGTVILKPQNSTMHIAIMINKRYLYKVILDVDDKSTVIHSNNTYPNDLETQLYKMEPKIFRL